jgi:sensor domain CHASE-containing protein
VSDFDLPFILSLLVSIIAVVLTYIDMRRRLRQEQKLSKSLAEVITTLREELRLFRKKSLTNEDLERQKLLAKREKQQWTQMKDVAKAVGWLLEHAEGDYEEEE